MQSSQIIPSELWVDYAGGPDAAYRVDEEAEFKPNCEHQRDFYNDEEHDEILMIGGSGAGKTTITIRKIIKLGLKYPGLNSLVTRTTGPALRATTFKHFLSIVPKNALAGPPVLSPYPIVRFRNGTNYEFIAFDGRDVEKVKSSNYGLVWMEEGSIFKEKAWDDIYKQTRQTRGDAYDQNGKKYISRIPRQFRIITTNSAGRNWIWRKFTRDLATENGRKEFSNRKRYCCTTYCNRDNLPPAFIRGLERFSEQMKRRVLFGEDDELQGLVFPMYNPQIHILTGYRDWVPPTHWPVFIGMDSGFQTPTTAIFVTITESGVAICFNEYGAVFKTPRANAQAILAMIADMMRRGMALPSGWYMDPAASQRKGESEEGKSIMEQLMTCGLPLRPGSKNLMGRIARMQIWLEPNKDRIIHPILENTSTPDGAPELYFTENCPRLCQEINEWEWQDYGDDLAKNPKERPVEKNDHFIDGASYVLAETFNPTGLDPISIRKHQMSDAYKIEQHRKKTFEQTKRPYSGWRERLS